MHSMKLIRNSAALLVALWIGLPGVGYSDERVELGGVYRTPDGRLVRVKPGSYPVGPDGNVLIPADSYTKLDDEDSGKGSQEAGTSPPPPPVPNRAEGFSPPKDPTNNWWTCSADVKPNFVCQLTWKHKKKVRNRQGQLVEMEMENHCSGTLIPGGNILTAGHCMDGKSYTVSCDQTGPEAFRFKDMTGLPFRTSQTYPKAEGELGTIKLQNPPPEEQLPPAIPVIDQRQAQSIMGDSRNHCYFSGYGVHGKAGEAKSGNQVCIESKIELQRMRSGGLILSGTTTRGPIVPQPGDSGGFWGCTTPEGRTYVLGNVARSELTPGSTYIGGLLAQDRSVLPPSALIPPGTSDEGERGLANSGH